MALKWPLCFKYFDIGDVGRHSIGMKNVENALFEQLHNYESIFEVGAQLKLLRHTEHNILLHTFDMMVPCVTIHQNWFSEQVFRNEN
jgi:hypothetical protein